MDRLIAPNSVPFAQADVAPATGTPQYATDGNPATNVPATQWPAYAFNTLQDEVYNVIIAAGLTPDRTKWNQLLTAIQTMLQGSTTNVAIDTGVANAYVVAFTPALTAPVPWVPFWFEVKTTNTGPSTLNATGTVEPLVGAAHAALQGNELVANGNALVYWNPTLAAGAGSYVLLFCSGAAEQVGLGTKPAHAAQLSQLVGVVGTVRNLKASLIAAATSITYTADQIIGATALNGIPYLIANFNATLNGTTTGIGGLDTGALAANSWYAIYAAENPLTGAQGIFAQLEPSGGATTVYTGAHEPAGYTVTALIGAWLTNGSAQFVVGQQKDRRFGGVGVQVISTSSLAGSYTSLNIAAAVPKCAIKCDAAVLLSSSVATTISYGFGADANGSGASSSSGGNVTQLGNTIPNILIGSPQTIYYKSAQTAGTTAFQVSIGNWEF